MLNKKYLPLLIVLGWFLSFIIKMASVPEDKSYEIFLETQSNISKAYIAGDFGEAQRLSQQAIESAENRKDWLEAAFFLDDLAKAYDADGKNGEAEKTYKRRTQLIEEKGLQTSNVDAYYDLAIFYYRQKRCLEANAASEKYLNWRKFADGSENTESYRNGKSLLEHFKQKHCSQ